MENSKKEVCISIESEGSLIYLGGGAYNGLAYSIEPYISAGIFILVDEHTEEECLPKLIARIPFLEDASVIRIPSGEQNKKISTCEYIWQELLRYQASRSSLLINLGGGVLTDMGGFAASVFKRGMDFINIPTSLMGQIDASIGGKTGIDFRNLKNQIGMFSYPQAILVDPEYLRTLSKRDYFSGFAELIKYALISKDSAFRASLLSVEEGAFQGIEDLIERAIRLKVQVADSDKFDKGERKKLNFGHTIGHAIETLSIENENCLSLLHGEAVVVGMICESYISYKRGYLNNEELDEMVELIGRCYTPFELISSFDVEVLEYMKYDKKNEKGVINAVLVDGKGNCFLNEELEDSEIVDALNFYRQYAQIKALS